jgi:hypothetical protein
MSFVVLFISNFLLKKLKSFMLTKDSRAGDEIVLNFKVCSWHPTVFSHP